METCIGRSRWWSRSRRTSTCFVDSTVNQVIGQRFRKRQQTQWTKRGAHLFTANSDKNSQSRAWRRVPRLVSGFTARRGAPGSLTPRFLMLSAYCILERRHRICMAMRAAQGYLVVLYRSTPLIRRENGRDAATSGFDCTRHAGKGP
jgi:hypothetical protein